MRPLLSVHAAALAGSDGRGPVHAELSPWRLYEDLKPRPPAVSVRFGPVLPLAIQDVVPGVEVAGPVPDLAGQVRDLHRRFRSR